MLIGRDELLGVFICPRSGLLLNKCGDSLISETEDGRKFSYPLLHGCPILIDYENSIIDEVSFTKKQSSSAVKRNTYPSYLQFLKRIISPAKSTTAANVERILKLIKREQQPKILIIGGGTVGQGMKELYEDENIKLIAFDVYISSNVQFIADAHNIPLPDSYFDCVIIQAVLEHVLQPSIVVAEIYRLLKSDGVVYSETPFLQHVHEGPYDFTRFTDSGHRYLFKKFELIDSGASAGLGVQLLWSIDYFFAGVFRSRIIGKLFKLVFFWLRYADKFIPAKYAVDGASGTFFLGRKAKVEINPKDIVPYYKGSQT